MSTLQYQMGIKSKEKLFKFNTANKNLDYMTMKIKNQNETYQSIVYTHSRGGTACFLYILWW